MSGPSLLKLPVLHPAVAYDSHVVPPMANTANTVGATPSPLQLRKAFFFDIDGTLVDSNHAHALSWQRAFETVAHRHYPYARIRRLIGMPGNTLIPMLSGIQENSPEGQKISRTHSEVFLKKFLPTLRSLSMARELIQSLRGAGIKTAVVTSLKRGEMEKLLHQVQLLGSFDLAVCIDDLEESRSKRNTIALTMDKLQLQPKDVYYVADTPYDIEAADQVQVQTIALRSGGWDDDGLTRAFRIFEDPSEMLTEVQAVIPAKTAA